MKKQDYLLLAKVLAAQRRNTAMYRCEIEAKGALQALDYVAIVFAESAHVDKQAFLKACGIE